MVFKKFDEQQVYQVPSLNKKPTDGAGAVVELKVGDVFSQNPSTHEISKITTKANALAAIADQKELYLVAQSDAVTEKTGVSAVKTYIIDRDVTIGINEEKIVAAYRITMIDNVEGWED